MDTINFYSSLIDQFIGSLISAGNGLSGNLVSEGTALAGVIFMIMLSWYLLDMLVERHPQRGITAIMHLLVKLSIVMYLLTGWTSVTNNFFVSNMNSLAATVGGNTNTSAFTQTIWKTAMSVLDPNAGNKTNCYQVSTFDINDPGAPQITETVCSDARVNKAGGLSDILLIPELIAKWIVKILTMFALIILMGTYILVLVMGRVLLAIGIAVGPILVPWLMFTYMQYLFDNWLKFMIGAGMYQIVASIMVAILTNGIPLLYSIASKQTGDPSHIAGIDLATNVFICVIAFITAYLLLQVPMIVAALTGGGTGGNGVLAGGVKVGKSAYNAAKSGASVAMNGMSGSGSKR